MVRQHDIVQGAVQRQVMAAVVVRAMMVMGAGKNVNGGYTADGDRRRTNGDCTLHEHGKI